MVLFVLNGIRIYTYNQKPLTDLKKKSSQYTKRFYQYEHSSTWQIQQQKQLINKRVGLFTTLLSIFLRF